MRLDVNAVKQLAAGRWPEILAWVGIPREFLHFDKREGPCPKCGGDTRFRGLDEREGALLCSHCFFERNGDGIAAVMWWTGKSFAEVCAMLAAYLGAQGMDGHANRRAGSKPKPQIFATPQGLVKHLIGLLERKYGRGVQMAGRWQYETFWVLRFDLPTPVGEKQKKEFRPVHQVPLGTSGDMGWQAGYPPGLRPLYHRSDITGSTDMSLATVHGGEKAVDAAVTLGLLATTNAGGEKAIDKTDWSPLLRFTVVAIVVDNDVTGETFGQKLAGKLKVMNPDLVIKIIKLAALPPKGDIVEWVANGGTREKFLEIAAVTTQWEPAPTNEQQPPSYVPFPTDVLPAIVRDFVRQGATALGCDESFIALPLLSALASAVGNTRRIQLKRSWCEPCIVWAVIVGDSGTMKSPAFDLAMEPLRRRQSAAFHEWEEAMATYRTDKATYEADLAEWKRKGRKNGEPPPEEPEEPMAVRYVCEDTTVEALAVLLQNQSRGLLLARDELAGWVNGFDAYKSCRGTDVAHWLSMHRAGPMTVDRKSGKKLIYVSRASVSITGGVQPKALGAALIGRYQAGDINEAMDKPNKEHFDNGLAARLLFAMPPRLPKKWTEADLPQKTESAMETLFGRLLELDFLLDEEGKLQPIDVDLSAGGKAAWVQFYNEHAQEQANLTGDLAAAWSKLEGYAARFALLVHLIRVASEDAALIDANQVDAKSVAAGVTLARWFGDEAARVYAIIGGDVESPEAREQRELIRIIRDHGGEITVRGLMKASRRYRSSAEEAEAALGRLVVSEVANVWTDDHAGGRGRPVLVFTLTESGDGNTNSEDPEKTGIVLPLPDNGELKTQSGDSSDGEAEWTG